MQSPRCCCAMRFPAIQISGCDIQVYPAGIFSIEQAAVLLHGQGSMIGMDLSEHTPRTLVATGSGTTSGIQPFRQMIQRYVCIANAFVGNYGFTQTAQRRNERRKVRGFEHGQ